MDSIYLLMQLSNIQASKSKTLQAAWSGQSYNIQAPESNLASMLRSSHAFQIRKDAGLIHAGKIKSTPLS